MSEKRNLNKGQYLMKNYVIYDKTQTWSTVYSFEFAQSYFHPMDIWDWFPQTWIRPHFNILALSYIYDSMAQF